MGGGVNEDETFSALFHDSAAQAAGALPRHDAAVIEYKVATTTLLNRFLAWAWAMAGEISV
jgi:hypothetical protein